jgi:hypothetical protein
VVPVVRGTTDFDLGAVLTRPSSAGGAAVGVGGAAGMATGARGTETPARGLAVDVLIAVSERNSVPIQAAEPRRAGTERGCHCVS